MKKVFLVWLMAWVVWSIYDFNRPVHTWVDDQEVVLSTSDLRPMESIAVIDLVTCEPVFVIGKGWRESGHTFYRVMRRVAVKVGGLKKTGYYWSVETRRVEELYPIPSI